MKSQLATAFGIFLALSCFTSRATRPAPNPRATKVEEQGKARIYVASHGWHTSLIVPADNLNRQIPDLGHHIVTPASYEIGRWDSEFYQVKRVKPALVLHTAFLSSDTVVHVSTVPISPFLSFPHSTITSISLSQDQLDNMGSFISGSMAHDGDGEVIPPGKGIYGESRFYRGRGHYSIINTCYNWTAGGLRSAALKISLWSKFSAKSVMRALENSSTLAATSPPATSP
jgi:uncharacterized protein (TIGR02117 family)